MSARQRGGGTASRAGWWALGAVGAGWALVYNVMRLGGSSPRQAAWISLAIGAVLGLAAVAIGHLVLRRLAASGRVLHRGPVQVPAPDRLTPDQRDAMRLASAAFGALAAAAVLIGLAVLAVYLAKDGDRSLMTLAIAAWNLLAGVWIGDEARRLLHGDADGVDTVTLGCVVTAVMAGVALSRSLVEPGQVVLIVLAGVAGALGGIATWRFAGAQGLPLAAVLAALVAAGALVLPLAA